MHTRQRAVGTNGKEKVLFTLSTKVRLTLAIDLLFVYVCVHSLCLHTDLISDPTDSTRLIPPLGFLHAHSQ